MNFWDQLRNYLRQRISHEAYENWIKGTSLIGVQADVLLVSVPDAETRVWLETEYGTIMRNGMRELGLPVKSLSFETRDRMPAPAALPQAPVEGAGELEYRNNSLNPKFTFGSFVVGSCNQFAAAAAKSVAENPSRS